MAGLTKAGKSTLFVLALAAALAVVVSLGRCGGSTTRPSGTGSITERRSEPAPASTVKAATIPPPSTPPPSAPRIDVSFDATLFRVLDRHRENCDATGGATCLRAAPYFSGQMRSGRSELRLVALAFPAESLETAKRMLAAEPRSVPDAEAALWILSVLSDQGDEAARKALVSVGLGGDPALASMALDLAPGLEDPDFLRPVLLKMAAEDSPRAVRLLARIGGPEARNVLLSLSADTSSWKGPVARSVLEVRAAVEGGTWAKTLQGALDGSDPEWRRDVRLALQLAANRPVPGMMELMRVRLEKAMRASRADFAVMESKRLEGALLDAEFERTFKTSLFPTRADPDYGHVLLAYWRLGGELSALEKGHLRHLGYGCDPKERLAELVAQDASLEAYDRELRAKLAGSADALPEWFRRYR